METWPSSHDRWEEPDILDFVGACQHGLGQHLIPRVSKGQQPGEMIS